jgi:hypothetical protein
MMDGYVQKEKESGESGLAAQKFDKGFTTV